MLACYPEDGSYFRRHIDNESKDGRCITCTLYLNRDWDIEVSILYQYVCLRVGEIKMKVKKN